MIYEVLNVFIFERFPNLCEELFFILCVYELLQIEKSQVAPKCKKRRWFVTVYYSKGVVFRKSSDTCKPKVGKRITTTIYKSTQVQNS